MPMKLNSSCAPKNWLSSSSGVYVFVRLDWVTHMFRLITPFITFSFFSFSNLQSSLLSSSLQSIWTYECRSMARVVWQKQTSVPAHHCSLPCSDDSPLVLTEHLAASYRLPLPVCAATTCSQKGTSGIAEDNAQDLPGCGSPLHLPSPFLWERSPMPGVTECPQWPEAQRQYPWGGGAGQKSWAPSPPHRADSPRPPDHPQAYVVI